MLLLIAIMIGWRLYGVGYHSAAERRRVSEWVSGTEIVFVSDGKQYTPKDQATIKLEKEEFVRSAAQQKKPALYDWNWQNFITPPPHAVV